MHVYQRASGKVYYRLFFFVLLKDIYLLPFGYTIISKSLMISFLNVTTEFSGSLFLALPWDFRVWFLAWLVFWGFGLGEWEFCMLGWVGLDSARLG